jgi:hypothetical protein
VKKGVVMVRKANVRHVKSHHSLLTDAWTADVQTLERGIDEFAAPPGAENEYHVSLFEMPGDPSLHVNVTHRQETKPVKGWAGPGVSAAGFIHNRTFDSMPTSGILRQIRQMAFAARA